MGDLRGMGGGDLKIFYIEKGGRPDMLREHRGESMKHLTSKNFKGSFSYKVVRQFNH